MSNPDQIVPTNADAAQTGTLKQRLLPICYFSAVGIAMAGWLWAIGRMLLATANWLLA
jgi:hypothetical protein